MGHLWRITFKEIGTLIFTLSKIVISHSENKLVVVEKKDYPVQ